MTIAGHVDKRVKLDTSLKRGGAKYYRLLSTVTAKVSYENKTFIKTTVKKQWEG